jgi:hypothetical protein
MESAPAARPAFLSAWPPARVAVLAAAALSLVGAAALTGWALVVLAGCVVVGAGLSWLSGLPLKLEERLAFGAIIGPVAFTMALLLLSLAFGLELATVLGALAIALAASAPGWWLGRRDLALATPSEGWQLWVLFAVCGLYALLLLSRSYTFTAGGLITGTVGAYGDWAAHLTYAGSFAYGHNFPPEFPIDPGHRLAYPFMVDLFAAALVPLGTSLTNALVLTSGLLALAFPAVMYLVGVRLVGSRVGAAAAVLVFLLSGGLGFAALVADLDKGGLAVLSHLPRLYTQAPDSNYQWLNPVLAWMLPQRSVLFGWPLALIAAALLWLARERRDWRPYAFTGVLVGLAPLFHVHGFGTAVVLAGFWALLDRRREWAAFFLPVLLLGLPALLFLLVPGSSQLQWKPGWLAGRDGPLWFWLKNTSLLVPLMVAGNLWRGVLPAGVGLRLAPIWLWFLIPNLVVLQPWDWDNTKFFAFWALFGSLMVGALLVALGRRGLEGACLAAILFVTLTLAGGLDLARAQQGTANQALFTDSAGIATADWVRANTDPRSIVLVAPAHNEPIPTLAGRRVVIGYGGWLWTYGLADWISKTDSVQRMLRGDPATSALLRQYHVDYVVVGPQEQALGANPAYWQTAARQVYSNGAYTVYRVG